MFSLRVISPQGAEIVKAEEADKDQKNNKKLRVVMSPAPGTVRATSSTPQTRQQKKSHASSEFAN